MVDSVCKATTRPQNSEAEIASGMGIGGAEVGDVGTGGIVSVGSSPCSIGTGVDCAYSVCEGSRGATMGWVPRGAK